LSAALAGSAESASGTPAVKAEETPEGWRLTGTEMAVPQAHLATRVVVPARTADGLSCSPGGPVGRGSCARAGVDDQPGGPPHLHLQGALVRGDEVLVGPDNGAAALSATLQAAWTGLCALAVGLSESALAMTAAYLNEREQFGRPLSAFQGADVASGRRGPSTSKRCG